MNLNKHKYKLPIPNYLQNNSPPTGHGGQIPIFRPPPLYHSTGVSIGGQGMSTGGNVSGAVALIFVVIIAGIYVTYKTYKLLEPGIIAAHKSIATRMNASAGNLYAMIKRGRAKYWSKFSLFKGIIRGNKRRHKINFVKNSLTKMIGNTKNNNINKVKNQFIKLVSIQAQPNGNYYGNNKNFINNILTKSTNSTNNITGKINNKMLMRTNIRTKARVKQVRAYGTLIVKLLVLYLGRRVNPSINEVSRFVISLLALYFIIVPYEYDVRYIQARSEEILNMCMKVIKEGKIVKLPRTPNTPNILL